MGKKIKNLGVMVDCSRDACYKPEAVEEFISVIARMGYDMFMLYTEDTYELEDEPYFGYMRGRYSPAELKRLDAFAREKGVELVPCIQTLAHLGAITRWQTYGEKCVDVNDILLVGQPETYALIDKMFARAAECFTSRRIHIGMDEAYMVGLGRYLDLHGWKPRFEVLREHLAHISEIAKKYGFSCMLWSDMFVKAANGGEYYPETFRMTQELVDAVPPEMQLVYWDYSHTEQSFYEKMIDGHRNFRNELWFSGVAWSCLGFTPHNRFSMRAADASMAACRGRGVENVLITSWKDDGAESSLFSVLPALAYIAANREHPAGEEEAARIFRDAVGEEFADMLSLDLPDEADGIGTLNNPVKYALYNDPFLGLFDYHLQEGKAAFFEEAEKKLSGLAEKSRFGYVYETLARVCSVMQLKYDLGIVTRRAYRAKDMAELKRLGEEVYPETARRVRELYAAFCLQWERECKPNGFEVHDIRLGGLACRLEHCGRLLCEYAAGSIGKIDPLDEDPLPMKKGKERGEGLLYSIWLNTAMTKPLN